MIVITYESINDVVFISYLLGNLVFNLDYTTHKLIYVSSSFFFILLDYLHLN